MLNREEALGLLCRCNEIGTVRGFIKITLNEEDLVAGSGVTSSIFSSEEVPTKEQRIYLETKMILKDLSKTKHIFMNNYLTNLIFFR